MLRRSMVMVFLCGCLAGCGGGLASGSGRVTMDGKPVDGAQVTFVPDGDAKDAGAPATATTDAQGQFNLATKGSPGIKPGAYKVTVIKTEGGPGRPAGLSTGPDMKGANPGERAERKAKGKLKQIMEQPAAKDILPKKYANPASTPLKQTIPPGGAKNIELTLTAD